MKNSMWLLMVMVGMILGMTMTHTFSSADWMKDQKKASQAQTEQMEILKEQNNRLQDGLIKILLQCKEPLEVETLPPPTPNN